MYIQSNHIWHLNVNIILFTKPNKNKHFLNWVYQSNFQFLNSKKEIFYFGLPVGIWSSPIEVVTKSVSINLKMKISSDQQHRQSTVQQHQHNAAINSRTMSSGSSFISFIRIRYNIKVDIDTDTRTHTHTHTGSLLNLYVESSCCFFFGCWYLWWKGTKHIESLALCHRLSLCFMYGFAWIFFFKIFFHRHPFCLPYHYLYIFIFYNHNAECRMLKSPKTTKIQRDLTLMIKVFYFISENFIIFDLTQ